MFRKSIGQAYLAFYILKLLGTFSQIDFFLLGDPLYSNPCKFKQSWVDVHESNNKDLHKWFITM